MPEDRKWRQLRKCAIKIGSGITPRGGAASYVTRGVPLIRSQNVLAGRLDLSNVAFITPDQHALMKGSMVRAGDVLLNITGASIGRSCVVPPDIEEANVNQHVCIIRLDESADSSYVSAFLNSSIGQRQIDALQGGGSREGLNYEQVGSIRFPPCTPDDQRSIAEILRAWDAAIETIERLITVKAVVFDRWSHQLLTGRRRLGRKLTNWRSVNLTEVAVETTARNRAKQLGADAVMGVNKQHGMIPMKDHVRAADLSRYKIVRPGAFAYNPMRLNIGSIAQNDHRRDVLVSPDYVAFETDPDALLATYFDHLRRTSIWSRFVKTAGSGGVRVRIYYEDLSDFVLDLPPVEEQARIVEALDTGRREIAILEQQRDALVKQKRGLMQKLLTGEWPVSAPKSREAAE